MLVPPARLGGRPGGRGVLAALALLAALGLAVVKPWGSAPITGPVAASPSNMVGQGAAVAAATIAPPATPASAAWPAEAAPGPDAADPVTIRDAARLVALRAGAWGVGAAGSGPRLVRDEVWADWLAVTPRSVPSGPIAFTCRAAAPGCLRRPAGPRRPALHPGRHHHRGRQPTGVATGRLVV